MVRELRQGNKKNGLVLANGGFMTHEHAIVLSSIPPRQFGFPLDQAHHDAVGKENIPFQQHAEGEAVIEVSLFPSTRVTWNSNTSSLLLAINNRHILT